MSIEATIQRAADGDQTAWDTIVQTYWRKVFNVAYRFVGTYEEAEDLTQEIFLKVFRSLSTFDRRANFQTWLISVSRNFCIDRYRSGRRDREVFAREVDARRCRPRRPASTPYARVELQDRVALLREALRALSPPLRTAVLLRDIHELSYQEIAAAARRRRGHGQVAHQPRPRRAGDDRSRLCGKSPRQGACHERDVRTIRRCRHRARGARAPHAPVAVGVFDAGDRARLREGARKIVINFGGVEYLDSAAIGCLMDLYRQATAAGATLKLAGLRSRVETMLTLTGTNQFMEIHPDAAAAVKSF